MADISSPHHSSGALLTLFVHVHAQLGHGSGLETRVWPVFPKRSPQLLHRFPLEQHEGAAERGLDHPSCPRDPGACFGTRGKYKTVLEIKLYPTAISLHG